MCSKDTLNIGHDGISVPHYNQQLESKSFIGCCKQKSTTLENTAGYIQLYLYSFSNLPFAAAGFDQKCKVDVHSF